MGTTKHMDNIRVERLTILSVLDYYSLFLLMLYHVFYAAHELPDAGNLFCQVKEGFFSNSMVFVRQEISVGYQSNHFMCEIIFYDPVFPEQYKYFPVCVRYAEVMCNGHFTSEIEDPVEQGKKDHGGGIEISFIMKVLNAYVFQGPQDPSDTVGYQKILSRSVPHHTGYRFPLRFLTTGYPLHGGSAS